MFLLLLPLVLSVTSSPVATRHHHLSLPNRAKNFLQALSDWNSDKANPKTTMIARGEMDRILVHRHLLEGLTHEVGAISRRPAKLNVLIVHYSSRDLCCQPVPLQIPAFADLCWWKLAACLCLCQRRGLYLCLQYERGWRHKEGALRADPRS